MWREATESEKSKVLAYGKAYGKRRYHIMLLVLGIITAIALLAVPPILYSTEANEAFEKAAGFNRHSKAQKFIDKYSSEKMDDFSANNSMSERDTYAFTTELIKQQAAAEEEYYNRRAAGNRASEAVYKKAYLPEAIVLGIAILIGLFMQYMNDSKLRQVKNDKFKVRDVTITDKHIRQHRRELPLYIVVIDNETDGYIVPHEIYSSATVGKSALLLKIESYGAWNDAYDVIV